MSGGVRGVILKKIVRGKGHPNPTSQLLRNVYRWRIVVTLSLVTGRPGMTFPAEPSSNFKINCSK